jgi:hypothetical protein
MLLQKTRLRAGGRCTAHAHSSISVPYSLLLSFKTLFLLKRIRIQQNPMSPPPPHIQISGHLPGSMQLVQCASHLRRRLGPTVDFVASKAGAYSKAANQLQGRCMLQRDFDKRRKTLLVDFLSSR